MTTSSAESPEVFISYTHDSPEHMDRILDLANRLRAEGVDANLDQYETSPPEGWPRWTNRQIEEANYVLVACTETYQGRFNGTDEAGKGLGAKWEGAIITQALYDAEGNNAKFVPVLFSRDDSSHVPNVLRGVMSYDLSSEGGFVELYKRLTNQPRATKPELGGLRPMPPRARKQFFFNTWNIPYTPNPFFTGREDVLRQLHEALETKGTAAVSGMPGVGKTQTAVEYAHRHRTEFRLILWARADTRETLISDYVNIAGTLQLPEVRAQEQNLAVGAVKRWLDANPDWLLILDNADDLALAREFIPAAPKGRIIPTTRAQATGAIATNVEVLKMEDEEGALFLLRRSKLLAENAALESAAEVDRTKAIEITKEVGGLPLALDQAGAFIEESSSSPAEYLDLYRTQGTYLRSQRGELAADHPESVAITFSLSFEKVEAANPTAADLLRACAFLAPDSIPEEIFTESGAHLGGLLSATVNNLLALINAVKETLRYSLLRRDRDAHTLSIHRVVQDVLKDTMDESAHRQWAERIVKAVNQVLPEFDETDISEWHRFERILPHAQVCVGLVERWDLKFPEAAQLLNNTARYMHNHAVLTGVEPLYVRALAIREYLYEQDNLDVATSLHNLGWLKRDQGKYSEAELLYLQALEIRKRRLGEHNVIVARSLQELGNLKRFQGKYAEAKTYLNQSIESLKAASASDDSILAESLGNLGNVLISQGKYVDAESVITRALKISEKVYGSGHSNVAGILDLLGRVYNHQGQYLKAEPLFLRARKIIGVTYGEYHPAVAYILDGLADIYYAQNKFADTETHLLLALTIMEKVYGKDHPETSTALNNLGLFYQKRGNFIKAEELYRRSHLIKENTLDANHPELAINLGNLAILYSDSRKYSEADRLFRKAILILKKSLQPEHPDLLNIQNGYADLLRRMNRKGEAQKLADHVRKMRAKQERKKPRR
jgi:tetratricopeptide (TPR) repeat protein